MKLTILVLISLITIHSPCQVQRIYCPQPPPATIPPVEKMKLPTIVSIIPDTIKLKHINMNLTPHKRQILYSIQKRVKEWFEKNFKSSSILTQFFETDGKRVWEHYMCVTHSNNVVNVLIEYRIKDGDDESLSDFYSYKHETNFN